MALCSARGLQPGGDGKATCQPHRGPVLKGEQGCGGEETAFMPGSRASSSGERHSPLETCGRRAAQSQSYG